jgi:hypothetical protein
MAISSTLPAFIPSATIADRTVAAPTATVRHGLLARCRGWLVRRNTAACLRELDPHLADDIGVAPNPGRRPEGFAVDPGPLWGIGLAPMPRDLRSPWTERCRG